jgi:hypothetical protein
MVRRGDDGESSALPNVDRFSMWVGSIAAALLKHSAILKHRGHPFGWPLVKLTYEFRAPE